MSGKKIITTVVVVAVLLFALIILSNSLFIVQQNQYGVVLEFSAVREIKNAPGLYFKTPFIQSVSELPKTVLLYDLPISDVITADKHSMVLDSFTLWRISDPRLFIESLSGSLSNA